MRVALLGFVSVFCTRGGAVGRDGSLDKFTECLDLESFKHTGKDGKIFGQCTPSESPGAFYTVVGDEATGEKAQWECLDKSASLPDDEQTKHKIEEGFAGFCKFGSFHSQQSEKDIELCKDKPFHCSPGPKKIWGACVAKDISNWECISPEDHNIADYIMGDCRSLPVQRSSQELYQSVCRFATETDAGYPKRFKCPTDLLKDKDLIIKGDATDSNSVCYIMEGEAEGVARPVSVHYRKDEGQESSPCEWTPTGVASDFFDGECLLKTHNFYEQALDWPTERGSGAGLIILFVCLILAAGGGGFLFWQRTKQRQPRQLTGGLMR